MDTPDAQPGYIADKAKLGSRMRRIEGQVRGIQRMIEDERYCIEILTQINAVQAALDKVGLNLLEQHAAHCVIEPDDAGERADKTSELMAAVARFTRRG